MISNHELRGEFYKLYGKIMLMNRDNDCEKVLRLCYYLLVQVSVLEDQEIADKIFEQALGILKPNTQEESEEPW